MFRLRLAILGAAATLALGTASALAMTESATNGDSDSHGDAVASAAHSCPHGAGGVHGACVSSVARTNGEQHRASGQPATVAACKDKTRTGGRGSTMGIGACVSAAAGGSSTSGSSETSESAATNP